MVTQSGQNLTEWTDEIWQLLHHRQRAQLAEGLGLYWAATKEGLLLSMCEVGKKHSVQLTELHPDARARFAVDFRLLFHDGDAADNPTICSHKQVACCMDKNTPTLPRVDGSLLF